MTRNDDEKWPPRSWDLTPRDFLLWKFVKHKVRAGNIKTFPELKIQIQKVIEEM